MVFILRDRPVIVKAVVTALLICVVFMAVGCDAQKRDEVSAEPTGATFAPPDEVVMPQVDEDGEPIDVTHVAEGYVVVRESSASRLKFQVAKGDSTYNYDIPNDGSPSVFPMNMGDGDYLFRIMKNTGGNDYMPADNVEANVELVSEFAPYVIPNQYCDYDGSSACVAKARELTADAENQGDAVKRVCEFVVDNVSYDMAKAQELSGTTGYIPDPDETLAEGTGVCFDYASLGAAMLRSLGIPTKIITGYVSPGDLYHAWIMVYIDGSWQTGEFSVNPDSWSRVDLTFAASGSNEFTGDGTSYTDRYIY